MVRCLIYFIKPWLVDALAIPAFVAFIDLLLNEKSVVDWIDDSVGS